MNKLSKDVIISIVFSVLNVIFNFWLIQKAEYTFSIAHLTVFLYIRRIAPTFSNLFQLGTSQALIRYTSIYKEDKEKIKIYYLTSIFIWLIMTLLLVIIFVLFGKKLSQYFFTESKEALQYFKYTLLYIVSLHLGYIILPYFLNLRKILIYNIFQSAIASVIMLLVFMFFKQSIDIKMLYKYSLFVILSLLLSLLVYSVVKLKLYKFPDIPNKLLIGKNFIKYGLPRTVITFSDMFLLTVGAILIHKEVKIIGGFLIGIALSRVVLIVLQPISLLSAVISGHANTEDKHQKIVNLLIGGTLYITIIVSVMMFNWIDILLPYWLKNNETIALVIKIFKLLSLGLVPYALFQALKSIIEIKFIKPLNLYALTVAIGLHILLYIILQKKILVIQAISISLMISFVSLGCFSLFWNRKYLKPHTYFKLIPLIILNTFLFIFNYIIHLYYPTIIGFIFGSFISLVLYLIFIIKVKIEFIEETMNLFKIKTKKTK